MFVCVLEKEREALLTIKNQAEILADTPPPPPPPRFSFMKYLSSKNKVSHTEAETQHTVLMFHELRSSFHHLDISSRKMLVPTLSFPPTARPPWSPPRRPPWLWWMAPPRPLMTRTSLQWWRLKRSLQSRSKPIRLPRGSDSSDLEIKTTDDDGDVFLNSDHKYIVLTGQSPAEL